MGLNHFEAPWEGPNLRLSVDERNHQRSVIEQSSGPLPLWRLGRCRNIYKRFFPSRLRGRF